MAGKKGFWTTLFGGGGCSCGMSIEEDNNAKEKQVSKGGCCDMQIVEADANENDAERRNGK